MYYVCVGERGGRGKSEGEGRGGEEGVVHTNRSPKRVLDSLDLETQAVGFEPPDGSAESLFASPNHHAPSPAQAHVYFHSNNNEETVW